VKSECIPEMSVSRMHSRKSECIPDTQKTRLARSRARERSETRLKDPGKYLIIKEYTVSLPIVSTTLRIHTDRHGSE
jgi:hypothetical protein